MVGGAHVLFAFFFQAEDGIRDSSVTGVQTCALPISGARRFGGSWRRWVFSQPARTSLAEDGGLPSPLALGAWISRLDAVVISHGCSAHIGMHAVLHYFRPRELWIGPLPPIPAVQALLERANNLGITIVRRCEGDIYELRG